LVRFEGKFWRNLVDDGKKQISGDKAESVRTTSVEIRTTSKFVEP
jgi:hypothetical protein